MSESDTDEPILFQRGDITVDLVPLVRLATTLLAPSLRPRHREICVLVSNWMESGAARVKWPEWAQDVSAERRQAVAMRVLSWLSWLQNMRHAQLKMNSVRWAPVTQIEVGVEACATVKKLAERLYAADDPPILPLKLCRKLRCACILKTMTHSDFGASDEQCVVITGKRKTSNGSIAEIGFAPKRLRRAADPERSH